MTKKQEIEAIESEITSLRFRIGVLNNSLRSLENSLSLFKNLKVQYLNNLRVLRNPLYITSILEFKRTRGELQHVKDRMHYTQIEYNNTVSEITKTERRLEILTEKYVALMPTENGTVIRGDFGGKNRDYP